MIVDSPGVGESNAMNEFALSYLPHAFCFIYVINSSNAGGIQEDRVRRPLLPFAKRLLHRYLKNFIVGRTSKFMPPQGGTSGGCCWNPVCHVDT